MMLCWTSITTVYDLPELVSYSRSTQVRGLHSVLYNKPFNATIPAMGSPFFLILNSLIGTCIEKRRTDELNKQKNNQASK
ncbi:hypothetical protein DL95DRAFT_381876 [Leptodontidium sp. 2 PMI_412]|nr:hypothetical protein DL95DRAFT_381876 [Leptodontidium sp. 2 PMI_412]